MKQVKIYTDGSCDNRKTKAGGWAAILLYGEVQKVVSGYESNTTNNRMELQGAIEGLKALKYPCEVNLYTDSQYIITVLQSKRKHFDKNDDLCQEFRKEAKKHHFTIHWVKGHNGDIFNEMADREAVKQYEYCARQLCVDKLHRTKFHYAETA